MSSNGPLKGIKVIDFSKSLAGPYGSMLLADMGAEVIKIEVPGRGDDSRGWGPPFIKGEAAYFLSINRNKKSLTLNLKNEKALKIALKLIKNADVVFETNRPGTMKRLRLDYKAVRRVKPDIIYCSLSGFGQTGPYSNRPGYDQVIQGYGGIMGLTGEADGPPMTVGIAVTDIATGMFAVTGILAALYHREKTGEGQYIDASMLDGQVSWLTYQAGRYLASGEVPRRTGSVHPLIAPDQPFKTKDGFINIVAGNNNLWKKFCKAAGLQDIAEDPRFTTNAMRVENCSDMAAAISKIIATKTVDEWLDILNNAGVPCGPINTVDRILSDPHVLARDMLVEIDHPRCGKIKVTGFPVKFSKTPAKTASAPPTLGQHNEEIFKKLGFSGKDIKQMKEDKII